MSDKPKVRTYVMEPPDEGCTARRFMWPTLMEQMNPTKHPPKPPRNPYVAKRGRR